MRIVSSIVFAAAVMGAGAAHADTVTLHMVTEKGPGKSIGEVALTDSTYGLVLTPKLNGLTAGLHGFHVHTNGSCDPKEEDGKPVPAGAAGGHYDPRDTKKHGTPWDDEAHAGDLPALYVDADGNATQPVLAPRLKLADVKNRALMIHVGADNHSDHPKPLGGGGARMACGVIK